MNKTIENVKKEISFLEGKLSTAKKNALESHLLYRKAFNKLEKLLESNNLEDKDPTALSDALADNRSAEAKNNADTNRVSNLEKQLKLLQEELKRLEAAL